MHTKKFTAVCLSILLIFGSVAIPGFSVFAAGGTEVYSEGFEGYTDNTDLHYYGKYTAEGEPEAYGVAGKLSTNMLAGYLAQDEDGAIYRTTFGATVYGRDGTAYTQTAAKGAVGSSDVIQVSSALAHSGTKSLMIKPNARVMSLPLRVQGGTSYQLTFYGTNNGVQGDGGSKYFGATVMTTLNIGQLGTLQNNGATGAAGSGGDISNITGQGAGYQGDNVFCLAHTGKILYNATSEFEKFTLNFTTSEQETYTTVYLSFFASAGMVYYIDDVSLVDVTPAPQVATEVYDLNGNLLQNTHEYLPVTAANATGGVTLSVNTAALAGHVEFVGWYQNGSLASFEESLTVAKDQALSYTARFVTKNLAAASASFEDIAVNTNLYYYGAYTESGEPEAYGADGKWSTNMVAGYLAKDAATGAIYRTTFGAPVYGRNGTAYTQTAAKGATGSSGTVQLTGALSRSGSQSLQIAPNARVLSLPLKVQGGTKYRLTFYGTNNGVQGDGGSKYFGATVMTTLNIGQLGTLKGDGSTTQAGSGGDISSITGLGATYKDGDNVFCLANTGKILYNATTNWEKFELTFTTAENAYSTVYLSLFASSNITYYIDDISLVDTNAESLSTGLTTAYNGVAALRTGEASDTGKNGLRIYNQVTKAFLKDKNIVEYGSIATLGSLVNAEIGKLTFENGSGTFVTGVSYNQLTKPTPVLWNENETANIYTAYLTGIPAKRYADSYVIRAYAKSADGTIYYGKELKICVFDIVWAIDCGSTEGPRTEQDIAAFHTFAAGEDSYASYDAWLKANLLMPGDLRGKAKAADTLSGAELTNALEVTGQYNPFFARSIANTGNRALLKKALQKANKTINLVGLGGSITLGDTTRENDSYVSFVRDFLQQQGYTVNYTNAGIGGTTSVLGVARIKQQVLACKPDLVLVDFTTNDQTDSFYADSYEAVLRTLLQNNIATIGVLFGNVDRTQLEQGVYRKGTNREDLHAPALLYYDIPIIDYYGAMWENYLDADGDGINKSSDAAHWQNLWMDYIHPNEAGHRLAGGAVSYYLAQVIANLAEITETQPALAPALGSHTESFMGAEMLEYNTAGSLVTATTGTVTQGTYNNGDKGYNSEWKTWLISEGGSVTFTVPKCKSIGIMRAMTAQRGTATITVNGQTVTDNANFSGKMNSLQGVYFGNGEQTFTVTVAATSGTYEIISMLIAQEES